jgi:hypothetical protein
MLYDDDEVIKMRSSVRKETLTHRATLRAKLYNTVPKITRIRTLSE